MHYGNLNYASKMILHIPKKNHLILCIQIYMRAIDIFCRGTLENKCKYYFIQIRKI